ncbi:kinase-like domain-containing protein [Aspergillus pseudodeflectus]|uniref:Kinase-like domain-containing protein n=1 Tax=Aspergillus pseudodeflectus TaxID=176178 RepID=A0ABR4JR98_9EURO
MHKYPWDRVYKVGAANDEIVVKYGHGVKEYESQVLIFLERYVPTIPAPRLYAMYRDLDTREMFLIMQRIPGERLESVWPTLTESEKDDLVVKLRQIFNSLKEVQCAKPDFYGGLDGGFLRHYLFHNRKGGKPKALGPFQGEASFVAGLVGNFRAQVEKNRRPDYKVRFYKTHLATVLQGHRPTLTHGDVQMKNIMVAEKMGQPNGQGDRAFHVVFVDWAEAGWYPAFWEFFCASTPFVFLSWEHDWCWRALQFLDVFPAELGIMRRVDKDFGL